MKTIGMIGKTHSEATKAKMRAKALGRKHTEETKRKLSEDNKKRWVDGRMSIDKIRPFIEAGSNATRGKPNPSASGENNHYWKGNNVSYSGVHHWVKYHWGKPNECENCHGDYRRYEWANISEGYIRERWDWIKLCVPCHRRQAAGRFAIITSDI